MYGKSGFLGTGENKTFPVGNEKYDFGGELREQLGWREKNDYVLGSMNESRCPLNTIEKRKAKFFGYAIRHNPLIQAIT